MSIFNSNPFDVKKYLPVVQNLFAKRAMQDGRPEAEPRKGMFRFGNQMVNKKQQRLFTLNSDTLKRLSDTDPITWAIRRTIKGYVNQSQWDIVTDTEMVEQELDRYEEYVLAQLSPYSLEVHGEFKSDIIEPKLLKQIQREVKRVSQEPLQSTDKQRRVRWYFASVVRQIRQEAEGHRHEVKRLFEKPSERGIESTFRTLQELVVDDLLVYDAGAIVKNYSRLGKLAELYHLPGDELRIYRNEDRTIPDPPEPAYVWEEDGMIRAEFTRDELMYIMQNPQSNGYGMSPLEVAAYVITASVFAEEYNIDFFKNSNVPPGVFHLGKDITEEQRGLFQQMWENEVRGRGGLHRMLFISGSEDPKFIPIQPHSNREMQMMEYLKWTLAVKTSCYGLSGQDIGFVVDYHRTTSETQAGISQARGVRTILTLLEQYYNTEIVKKEFDFDDVKFAWQDIDTTDEEKESRIDAVDIQNGVLSRNERRKKLGLKPIDGGDTVTVSTQVLPIANMEGQDEEDANELVTGEGDAPEPKAEEQESEVPSGSPDQLESLGEGSAGELNPTEILRFTVNRKSPLKKQNEKIDSAIKALQDKGIDSTVKISFETPQQPIEK